MTAARSFGKYRPIVELGHGGMATVYLAASQGPRGFAKLVVVKELNDDLAVDSEFASMFVDEARLAARINHPHVVQTYEVDENDGRFFIVMEYIEGQPLGLIRSRLSKLGTALRDHQVRLLSEVLDALHHAHELADYDGRPLHVVHRDVSPHNVMVTYSGDAKLVDFGIAKAADSSTQTRTGVVKGKLAYMSPEQAFGKPLDRRTDIFAVGVVLWEALTNRRMWKGSAEGAIAHRLSIGDIPKAVELAPNAPPQLLTICDRALAPRMEDRYPTALAMKEDLEAYLASLARRPTARELGTLVAEAFSEERSRVRAIIEQSMSIGHGPTQPPPTEIPSLAKAGTLSSASASMSKSQVTERGYPVRWLVLGGIALIVVGAAVTTAVMAPWSSQPVPAGPPVLPDAAVTIGGN